MKTYRLFFVVGALLMGPMLFAQGMQRLHVLYASSNIPLPQTKFLLEAAHDVDPNSVIAFHDRKVLVTTRDGIASSMLLAAFNNTTGASFSLTPLQLPEGGAKVLPPSGTAGAGSTASDTILMQSIKAAWMDQRGINPGDPNTLIHE